MARDAVLFKSAPAALNINASEKAVASWTNRRARSRLVSWALLMTALQTTGTYTITIRLKDASGTVRDTFQNTRASYGETQSVIGPWNVPSATSGGRGVWSVPSGWTIEISVSSNNASDTAVVTTGIVIDEEAATRQSITTKLTAQNLVTGSTPATLAAVNYDRVVLVSAHASRLASSSANLALAVDITGPGGSYLDAQGTVGFLRTKNPTNATTQSVAAHNAPTCRAIYLPAGTALSAVLTSSNAGDDSCDVQVVFDLLASVPFTGLKYTRGLRAA